MADVQYSVLVDISTRGNLVSGAGGGSLNSITRQADAAHGSVEKLGALARTVGSDLSSAFTGAVESVAKLGAAAAMGGLVGAVGLAVHGVTGLNAELEKTQMSLAAIFSANKVSDSIGSAFELAGDMMLQMRKDAAALPGEYSDLVGIFKMIQIPGLRAGAQPVELEELAANIMAAGASAGLDMHMVAREAGQLMSGHSGAHNVLGSTLFGLQGAEAQKFNALSGEKRLEELKSKMGAYHASIGLFATSFDALTSTLKDNVKKVMIDSTQPLFVRVKGELGRINAWFDGNTALTEKWSHKIGDGLVTAFDLGVQKVEEWWPHVQTFASNAKAEVERIWASASPFLTRLEEIGKNFLSDPKAFDKIEDILKLYGAVRVGGMASSMVGGVSGVMSIGSAAEGAAGALGLAAGAEAIAIAAPLAVGALIATAGAIHAVNDESSAYHNEANFLWNDLKTNGSATITNLGNSFDALKTSAYPLADFMGKELLVQMDAAAAGANLLTGALSHLSYGFASIFNSVDDTENDPHARNNTRGVGSMHRTFDPDRHHVGTWSVRRGKLERLPLGGGHGAGTTIHKVEIVVSGNDDPARVARFVREELESRARNPTSGRTRNWSHP